MLQQEIDRRMLGGGPGGRGRGPAEERRPVPLRTRGRGDRGSSPAAASPTRSSPASRRPSPSPSAGPASPWPHRDLAPAVALITGAGRGDGAGPEINYGQMAHFPRHAGLLYGRDDRAAVEGARPCSGCRPPDAPVGHRPPRRPGPTRDRPLHAGHHSKTGEIQQKKLCPRPAVGVHG